MSDHFDSEDSRTDLTDLYIFPASDGGDRSVIILDLNPDATADEVSVDPAASYEIKIDTDGDLEPDVAFHVVFDLGRDGEATATAYRAIGAEARGTGRVGDVVVDSARVANDGSSEPVGQGEYRSSPAFGVTPTSRTLRASAMTSSSPAMTRSHGGTSSASSSRSRTLPWAAR